VETLNSSFPEKIEKIWSILNHEVQWLHGRWQLYCQLYGTSQERVDVLNYSAASFFGVSQEVMLNDVQLGISKLGDPAKSGKNSNMTLFQLLEKIKKSGELVLANKLEPHLKSFSEACFKVRRRRNKWIAHFDYKTMKKGAFKREGPSQKEIEIALKALRNVMNCVSVHYYSMTIAYEHFYLQADGETLLKVLMQGLRYKELVEKKDIESSDFRNRFGDRF